MILCFFFWGNREFIIFLDKISLYVGGIFYDMKLMLDIFCGFGVDFGKFFFVRWIFLFWG